ncbi:MAG: hypothetical protein IT477_10515 [Rhodanobacteraceae bacterium]|nr:hypothetical protein [Rhodanobacteraceae bacterium]
MTAPDPNLVRQASDPATTADELNAIWEKIDLYDPDTEPLVAAVLTNPSLDPFFFQFSPWGRHGPLVWRYLATNPALDILILESPDLLGSVAVAERSAIVEGVPEGASPPDEADVLVAVRDAMEEAGYPEALAWSIPQVARYAVAARVPLLEGYRQHLLHLGGGEPRRTLQLLFKDDVAAGKPMFKPMLRAMLMFEAEADAQEQLRCARAALPVLEQRVPGYALRPLRPDLLPP